MPPKKKKVKLKVKKPKESVKQTQYVTVNVAGAPDKPKAKRQPRKKKEAVAPFNAPRAGGGGGGGQEFRQVVFAPQVPQVPQAPQQNEDTELKSLLKQMFGGQQQRQQSNPLMIQQAAKENPLAERRIEQAVPEPPRSIVIPARTETRLAPKKEPESTTLRTRTPFIQAQAPTNTVSLAQMGTMEEVENMVKRTKPSSSIAESIAASSRDMDKPFGGGGGGEAAEEPLAEQERIISDALEVEAQAAAEKQRAKAGAAEDEPMPPPKPKKLFRTDKEAAAKEKAAVKAAKEAAKEAQKEMAKEEKATAKAIREDAAAKREAAFLASKRGGQIRK